ncbi:MAG: NYN domain-containing protein [Propionibacteriaceae bacterium]|nr:NYN domain-containing protein [Propionibacteriaceae bacterium]
MSTRLKGENVDNNGKRVRIKDVARDMGISNWEVLCRLHHLGDNSYTSIMLDEHQVRRLRAHAQQLVEDATANPVHVADILTGPVPDLVSAPDQSHDAMGPADGDATQTTNPADRVAVFIDIENLTEGGGYRADWCPVDFVKTFAALGEGKQIVSAAAYAHIPTTTRLGAIVDHLKDLNIAVKDAPNFRKPKSDIGEKEAADFQIYADAVFLAATRPDIGTFVIMSGDNGFCALASKLRSMGKIVVTAITWGRTLGPVYRRHIDRVVICEPREIQDRAPVIERPPRKALPTPVLPEVALIRRTVSVIKEDRMRTYCELVTHLFLGKLGAVIAAHGADGLLLPDVVTSLIYLIPAATALDVGFKHWRTMLRVALPGQYVIVVGSKPSTYRVVHRAYLQGRAVLSPYVMEDLGDMEEIHPITAYGLVSGAFPLIARWCAQQNEIFDARQCQVALVSESRIAGVDMTEVGSCLKWMSEQGFLVAVVPAREPADALVAASTSTLELGDSSIHVLTLAPSTDVSIDHPHTSTRTRTRSMKHYITRAAYSELVVLCRMVDQVRTETKAGPIPFGPKTKATFNHMKDRIVELRHG